MARFTDETYLREWRERQVLISSTAAAIQKFDEMIQIADDDETVDLFTNLIKEQAKNFVSAVVESATQDDNAYKLSYLRNFTAAYYRTTSRRMNEYDDFLKEFKFQIWGHGDHILTDIIGTDECNRQRQEACKMDRYMQLVIHVYLNRLLNLAQEDQLGVVTDKALIDEMRTLHHEFENQRMYDEIAAIRYQLIQSVMADILDFWSDEAAGRVFTVDAYELLNEINSKPIQLEPVGGLRG